MCNDYIRRAAWLAGIFDGEGSTFLKDNRIHLSISQKYREILDWIVNFVEMGRVGGPYNIRQKSGKVTSFYQYNLYKEDQVNKFIKIIYPFLSSIKKAQYNNCLLLRGLEQYDVLQDRNHEVDWATGFYQGEGSIWYNNRRKEVIVTISQSHPEVLERFREVVGAGRIEGPTMDNRYSPALYNWQYKCTLNQGCQGSRYNSHSEECSHTKLLRFIKIIQPCLDKVKSDQIIDRLSMAKWL